MKNDINLNIGSRKTSALEKLIKEYQLEKIANSTKLDNLAKEVSLLSKVQMNKEYISIVNKINDLENKINISNNTTVSKDDFISKYLSSEFDEIKESTIKTIKNEIDRKIEHKISKSKNQSKLLYFFLLISILSLILSILAYLK